MLAGVTSSRRSPPPRRALTLLPAVLATLPIVRRIVLCAEFGPCSECGALLLSALTCHSAASHCQRSSACVPYAATPPASDGARLAAGDVSSGRRAAGMRTIHYRRLLTKPHQSLFGQPQQQPMGISPQMMSPQVQGTTIHLACTFYARLTATAAPSPQMFAPPASPQTQSLFGQPQQQPAYVMPTQVRVRRWRCGKCFLSCASV